MIVLHHNDLDGRCAAAIVNLQVAPLEGEKRRIFIETDYKDVFDVKQVQASERVWIVDFSLKPDVMKELLKVTDRVYWIDHHKTAEAYDYGRELMGVRDFSEPGKSGALLAWEYTQPIANPQEPPLAVQLVSDYDTWQHKLDGDKEFNLGVMLMPFSRDPTAAAWAELFVNTKFVDRMIVQGGTARDFRDSKCEDYCKSYGFETEIGGHEAFAVNLYTFGSQSFGGRMQKYPICIGFVFDGTQFTVSLYSDQGVDTSVISKGFGGGGHSAASGFVCEKLPFKKKGA